ncbi:hypothetical protein F5Y10DRAFT_252955 [Nemania abortiva]|nr:hypothetical protein F5Y10DRAFT_252955 [Nemania abortiva]
MAFEQPDPSLYPPPASLQPKRPVAAEAASSTDEVTMVGRVGSTPTTARTVPEASSASGGKTMPASVPPSAMRTGPTPLSQTQKRPFAQQKRTRDNSRVEPESHPVDSKPAAPQSTTPQDEITSVRDNHGFPTLQVRISGHPATWPQEPEFSSSPRRGEKD